MNKNIVAASVNRMKATAQLSTEASLNILTAVNPAAVNTPVATSSGNDVLTRPQQAVPINVFRPSPWSSSAISTAFDLSQWGGLKFIPIQIFQIGVPLDQLTIPVSLTMDVKDTVLFAQGNDAGKKFYLPCYKVDEQNVVGQGPQYRIALQRIDQQGGGTIWTLTIHLKKHVAAEIVDAARVAIELDHSVTVSLRMQVPVGEKGRAAVERTFQEVTHEEGGVSAVLTLSTLSERDQILLALTDPQYHAALVVHRMVHALGIPTGQSSVSSNQISSGSTTLRGTWLFNFDTGVEGGDGDVWWEQETDVARQMVPRGGAQIVNLGAGANFDALGPENLRGFGYSSNPIPGNADGSNQLVTNDIFAVRTRGGNFAKVQVMNYGYNLDIRWVTYQITGQSVPLYRQASPVVDTTVDPQPFIFPKDINPYIYGGITGSGGSSMGLVQRVVDWNGRPYSYYQDLNRPYIFNFLPDQFKLVRRKDRPYYPMMSVHFNTNSSLNDLQATVEYVAVPYINADRLASAIAELTSYISGPLPPHVKGPQFERMSVDSDKLKLILALPPSNLPQDITSSVHIDLWSGIAGVLTLNVKDFQPTLLAMLGNSLTLLNGQVHIDFGGEQTEDIDFRMRMNDLAGEMFDYEEETDAASGMVKVTLRNAIESPLQINQLSAALARGTAQVDGVIQGLNLNPAPVLQPGETLTFVVAPAAPLAGAGEVTVLFDLDNVHSLPDREKVLAAILDPSTPNEYCQPITVQAFSPIFAVPDGHPELQVNAISVQFERGDTVQVDANNLISEAMVRLPISDYVLNKSDQGQYRYKQTVVRNGIPKPDSQWRTDSSTILYPNPNA